MGDTLMEKGDEQRSLFAQVAADIEKIDQIFDQQIQPAIDNEVFGDAEKFATATTSANLEAEIHEIGFWVVNYQRVPIPDSKRLIFEKLTAFRTLWDKFKRLSLTPC